MQMKLKKRRSENPIWQSNLSYQTKLRLMHLSKEEQEKFIAETEYNNKKKGILIKSDPKVNPLFYIAKKEREIMQDDNKEINQEGKSQTAQDKLSFEPIIVDQDLYKKSVRSIDLSGLTRSYSTAMANGIVRIMAPKKIKQTFEGVFSTGREFQQSHGFIIVEERLRRSLKKTK